MTGRAWHTAASLALVVLYSNGHIKYLQRITALEDIYLSILDVVRNRDINNAIVWEKILAFCFVSSYGFSSFDAGYCLRVIERE